MDPIRGQELVSVIMPLYNAEQYVRESIDSVLNQTYKNIELIVIDDCSSDGSLKIAKEYECADERVRVIHNEHNIGVAKTRNIGMDMSNGEYIAFIDSDDVWICSKLEKQLKSMSQAGANWGFCSYSIIDSTGENARPDYIVPQHISFKSLLKENYVGCSTVILSGNTTKYRFATDFYHEDYVLWLQLLMEGNTAIGCTEVLAKWRLINNSRSFNKKKSAKNRWRIYRKRLKLPIYKSLYYMCAYILAGLKKYAGKKK